MASGSSNHQISKPLADNLHCYLWYGHGNNCNSCLFTNVLEGNRPHILIDPGHTFNEMQEDCLNSLREAIKIDGFSIDDVGLIINTHSHIDHCEANDTLSRKHPIRIAMSKSEEDFRHTLGDRMNTMFGVESPKFTTSLYLQEGILALGKEKKKLELQVLITPGHSPGSVCLYWPVKKVLITGDVLFFGSIGRTDFPGGQLSALKASINRLSQLDIDTIVPGHNTELGDIIKGKNVHRNFQAIKTYFG